MDSYIITIAKSTTLNKKRVFWLGFKWKVWILLNRHAITSNKNFESLINSATNHNITGICIAKVESDKHLAALLSSCPLASGEYNLNSKKITPLPENLLSFFSLN
jgi:hypothetical protein